MADVFAKYAATHLFDEIEEVGVQGWLQPRSTRLRIRTEFFHLDHHRGMLESTHHLGKRKGLVHDCTLLPAGNVRVPGGNWKLECINVEHEEVLLVPRWIKCQRVTFKYALGDQFIGVLKTLHMLGLDNKEKIKVKEIWLLPRDVVAACLPDPLTWATGCSD